MQEQIPSVTLGIFDQYLGVESISFGGAIAFWGLNVSRLRKYYRIYGYFYKIITFLLRLLNLTLVPIPDTN